MVLTSNSIAPGTLTTLFPKVVHFFYPTISSKTLSIDHFPKHYCHKGLPNPPIAPIIQKNINVIGIWKLTKHMACNGRKKKWCSRWENHEKSYEKKKKKKRGFEKNRVRSCKPIGRMYKLSKHKHKLTGNSKTILNKN